MDNRQEQLKNLGEIRSLMEKSSSFLSLSGLSGISAGVFGIIASVVMSYWISPFLDTRKDVFLTAARRTELIIYCVILMCAILILTFASVIFFTTRKAKKNNLAYWDGPAKRMALNLFIPLVAGGLFCIGLVYQYYDSLVLPSMLIFYGLSLVNASKYTLNDLRWLGIIEVLLGLTAMLEPGSSLLLWGAGFGVMNIIYGAWMYFRYER